MFVQALAAYADRELSEQLAGEAWEDKPVPYYLSLDLDGTFLGIIPNTMAVTRGEKTVSVAAPLSIPRSPVPRNSPHKSYPLLAADDIKYLLGVGPWTTKGQEKTTEDRHQAFVTLLREAAGQIDDDGLKAAAAFYNRKDQVNAARQALAETKAGSNVALALVTEPLVRRAAVRAHWSQLYAEAKDARLAKTGVAECLVSGKIGPIAPTHEKIKGLAKLGGQASGVALMSFDKAAFCSYGWEKNANSPVSSNRAMAYVLALNDLLKPGSRHRHDVEGSGIGFIFWTKEKTDLDPWALIDQPDPAQIQRLLKFNRDADPDPNLFYMAGVAGNGARMLIRYWITGTLGQAKRNLHDWYEGLTVMDVFTGELAEPPRFWQLRVAINREGEPPSDYVIALVRRAIEGRAQPLGYRMLGAALSRLRASTGSGRLDTARAGLIRLCLNDRIATRNQGEQPMTPTLDTGQQDAAYLCGRLMAVYESLQYTASGDVNQTVADRYYTLASTYPALAFPKMADLARAHLRKLRRDKPGAMIRISQELDQLHLQIEQASSFKFPKALDLDSQGRFVLGYHHQRAYQMAQAQAAKRAGQDAADPQGEQKN